jgi:hypothetical protein
MTPYQTTSLAILQAKYNISSPSDKIIILGKVAALFGDNLTAEMKIQNNMGWRNPMLQHLQRCIQSE